MTFKYNGNINLLFSLCPLQGHSGCWSLSLLPYAKGRVHPGQFVCPLLGPTHSITPKGHFKVTINPLKHIFGLLGLRENP